MKNQKFNTLILVTFLSAFLLFNCSNDDDDDKLGNWTEVSAFNNEPRSSATAFTLGSKGYMGTGFDGDDYLKDFWSYDFESNSWQQLADFPGVERSSAVAFTIGNSAFMGTGFNGDTNEEYKDFYQYNIASNTWSQIQDFAGSSRYGAVAFSSDTAGFVGTGFDGDGDKKDFWRYDPNSDSWTEIIGFGGNKRREGVVFKIGELVYLCTGINNGIFEDDFWVFNTTTETWSSLVDLDDEDDGDATILRSNAVAMAIDGKGYIACGETLGPLDTIWEYNPENGNWTEKTEFERLGRTDAISFSNGVQGFVALGRNGSLYLDDNMQFFPLESENDDDN